MSAEPIELKDVLAFVNTPIVQLIAAFHGKISKTLSVKTTLIVDSPPLQQFIVTYNCEEVGRYWDANVAVEHYNSLK